MWETATRETLKLCGILGRAYNIPGAGEIPDEVVVFNWGNGVLYDEEKAYKELKEQVSSGLLQPERLLGWYHNLPCDTPTQREKIRKDYMPGAVEEEE